VVWQFFARSSAVNAVTFLDRADAPTTRNAKPPRANEVYLSGIHGFDCAMPNHAVQLLVRQSREFGFGRVLLFCLPIRELWTGEGIEMLRTEHGEFRFKVKEGVGDVWIDAEPQSENGKMPSGITGMEFRLYTNDLVKAERIADFLNSNIRGIFVVSEEAK
jgi:hypothetical protein